MPVALRVLSSDPGVLAQGRDVVQVAGVEGEAGPEPTVAGDEHFVGEMDYLTYRKGRFKSIFHRRRMQTWALFDLDADPKESVNLIGAEREVSLQHLARVGELVEALATFRTGNQKLTEEDRARLRALGYLDQ